MLKQIVKSAAALAATLAAAQASAALITADYSWSGHSHVVGDVTVSAFNNQSGQPGTIGLKDIPTVGVGAGVQGQGNTEIDAFNGGSEVLRFTFGSASVIDVLELGLLFDGPEYSDFQEVAGMDVTFANKSTTTFKLQTIYVSDSLTNYLWIVGDAPGVGTGWTSQGIVNGSAGLWTGLNPFGTLGVLQIDFYAINGTCGTGLSCGDQSDYVFRSMTTSVPEPGTLALFGIGLLGMGMAARRRKQRA